MRTLAAGRGVSREDLARRILEAAEAQWLPKPRPERMAAALAAAYARELPEGPVRASARRRAATRRGHSLACRWRFIPLHGSSDTARVAAARLMERGIGVAAESPFLAVAREIEAMDDAALEKEPQ